MRRYALITMLAAALAAIPSSATIIGAASLATASLLVASVARAGTALLPGWGLSCGRDPRCFERGDSRAARSAIGTATLDFDPIPLTDQGLVKVT